jgi:hypothetical protein
MVSALSEVASTKDTKSGFQTANNASTSQKRRLSVKPPLFAPIAGSIKSIHRTGL